MTPADVPAALELWTEMDRFYGESADSAEARIPQITDALFGFRPAAEALVARDGDRIVGLAGYSFLWPAAAGSRSLFLKELYVMRTHQRRGVGRALMRGLAQIAAETGCSRLEWQTETGNLDARAFYASVNAPVLEGKLFYRLDGDGIAKLAE
jgi:GNAT superfamily N-acetyltransferase